MAKIEFVKEIIKSEFLNPMKDFQSDSQIIERRTDPLTGDRCRINIQRARRPKQLEVYKNKNLEKKCYFCPKNIEKTTPKFPPSLIPEGRIRVNDFVLFPNLFPFGKYHAVGVLGKKHSLELNEFTPNVWKDCITGCIRFFNIIKQKDSKARFSSINMNYSPFAGASIIHPHVQVVVDELPSEMTDKYFRKSWGYFDKNKSNFWQDLITQDKERSVGESDSMVWITKFAPICNDEIIGVMKGTTSSFLEMNEKQIEDLSNGISRILKGLYRRGVKAVNLAIFSAPFDEHLGHFFSLNIRIISRPSGKIYTSDRGFSEILHEEPIISTIPEELANDLRKFFK